VTFAAAALVAVAVALIAYSVYAAHRTATEWLGYLRHRDDDARAEREVLYRVLLSRTAGEFGSLDRIRQAPPPKGRPSMTRDEYEEMLREDMRGMGLDDRVVAGVPEGL
jgi:hypothetical protein